MTTDAHAECQAEIGCIFCDFHGSLAELKTHSTECPKHPMRAEIERLRSELEQWQNPCPGDMQQQAGAWVRVHRELVDVGLMSFLGSMDGRGVVRACEFVKHLGAEIERLREQNALILSGLRWTGDGYEWTGAEYDYRIKPEEAVERMRQDRERLTRESDEATQELEMVLSDWNDLREVIGSPTNGAAVGYGAQLKRERDEVRAELERLRLQRKIAISHTAEYFPRCLKLELQLAAVRSKLEEIVCTEGIDAGVVMLSQEGPTHQEKIGEMTVGVYDHEYFSPLGDALIEAWHLTDPNPPNGEQ